MQIVIVPFILKQHVLTHHDDHNFVNVFTSHRSVILGLLCTDRKVLKNVMKVQIVIDSNITRH